MIIEGCWWQGEVRSDGSIWESQYWQLILDGVGTVEACRIVGIGRKTGYRWRAENGGLPPTRVAEESRSSRCLSLLERQRIATLRAQGLSMRAIAEGLGRAPSTISRELRRNTFGHNKGIYDADLAQARARQRVRRQRRGRLLVDALLREQVQARLELEWSPEQIAAWLRRQFPDRPDCVAECLPKHGVDVVDRTGGERPPVLAASGLSVELGA
jgi:transposase